MEFRVRLVHAEPGRRVVEARALQAGQPVASALGEAEDAETAEDRALTRLRQRLDSRPAPSADRSDPGVSPVPHPVAVSVAQRPAPTPAQRPAGGEALAAGGGAPGDAAQEREPDPDPQAAAPPSPPEAASLAEAPGGGSAAALASAAAAEPHADPDDWSSELARVDLALRRIGWSREQEGDYLRRAFGHPSRSRITHYADLLAYLRQLEGLEQGADPSSAAVPLRRRDLLSQGDQMLAELGWETERARRFLSNHLTVASRSQLDDAQLLHFNMLLEAMLIAGRASGRQAPEPPA